MESHDSLSDSNAPAAPAPSEESSADAKGYNVKPGNSSVPISSASKAKVSVDPNDLYYDMSGEKYLIIFNHSTYKNTIHFGYNQPKSRSGTEEDEKSLKDVFGSLGFKVITYDNKDKDVILRMLGEIRNSDCSNVSCLCIAILTHGFKNGGLYAADRAYNIRDVLAIFEGHPTLVNKPKLFLVQACRGLSLDKGRKIQKDGDEDDNKSYFVTPSHADFLVLRSSVEDYISFRDVRGSWMIQTFCEMLSKYHEQYDILQIITLVQKKVAFEYESYTPRTSETHEKKQMPETSFTLTKFLKL